MKQTLRPVTLLAACLLLGACSGKDGGDEAAADLGDARTTADGPGTDGATETNAPPPEPLRVMTFNILCFICDPSYDPWEERLEHFRDVFARHDPDLIGMQELFLPADVQSILDRLPHGYAAISYPGGDGFNPYPDATLFYRTDRFEELEHGFFWLSPTPDEPMTTGFAPSQLVRLVAWAHLKRLGDGRELLFVTTHVDNNQPSQQLSAPLILERLEPWAAQMPVLVTGDFNSNTTSTAYRILTEGAPGHDFRLHDAYDLATRHVVDSNQEPVPAYDATHRIDHVFLQGGDWHCADWTVDLHVYGDHDLFPSDHRAISTSCWLPGDVPAPALVTGPPPSDWNPRPERTPRYVHLTWQHDPSRTLTFQWQTDDKDTAAYVPRVWLARADQVPGAEPTALGADVALPWSPELVHEGLAERYCQTLVCTPETQEGLQWTTEVRDLEPDTDYVYRVGTWQDVDAATGTFMGADLSPVYHVRTGLPKGDPGPFSFGFGSDSQNWWPDFPDQLATIRDTTGKDTRFWLLGGDLTETSMPADYANWFEAVAALAPYRPFMAVPGNHDLFRDNFFGQFALPRLQGAPANLPERAWSFTFGRLHVVGFDGLIEPVVADQVAFLEQDLKAAATDPDVDWTVVLFHQTAYSSSTGHASTDYIIDLAVPLFDQYGVDLSLSGHDHDYERTLPLNGGQIVDEGQGTVYVTCAGFYSQKYYGNGQSDFTAVSFDGSRNCYLVLKVDGPTLAVTAYTGDHEVLDAFSLTPSARH